jgi:hypothetical protein
VLYLIIIMNGWTFVLLLLHNDFNGCISHHQILFFNESKVSQSSPDLLVFVGQFHNLGKAMSKITKYA